MLNSFVLYNNIVFCSIKNFTSEISRKVHEIWVRCFIFLFSSGKGVWTRMVDMCFISLIEYRDLNLKLLGLQHYGFWVMNLNRATLMKQVIKLKLFNLLGIIIIIIKITLIYVHCC